MILYLFYIVPSVVGIRLALLYHTLILLPFSCLKFNIMKIFFEEGVKNILPKYINKTVRYLFGDASVGSVQFHFIYFIVADD